PVPDDQAASRVVEGAHMKGAEILPAQINQLAIKIDHGGRANAFMDQDLAEGRALAASKDQDILRRWMTQHGWLHEQLMVERLVIFRALDLAVQEKRQAVIVGLGDYDALVARPPGKANGLQAIRVAVKRIARLDA